MYESEIRLHRLNRDVEIQRARSQGKPYQTVRYRQRASTKRYFTHKSKQRAIIKTENGWIQCTVEKETRHCRRWSLRENKFIDVPPFLIFATLLSRCWQFRN